MFHERKKKQFLFFRLKVLLKALVQIYVQGGHISSFRVYVMYGQRNAYAYKSENLTFRFTVLTANRNLPQYDPICYNPASWS